MFTNENITEFMMNYYKDYSYVKSILKMPFSQGYSLYNKCIDRVKDEHEENLKAKYWDLFLIECQNKGYDGTFEDYYNSKRKHSETMTMTHIDKDSEIERIRNRVHNMDESKLKKKVIR